ncbi:MAG: hypothetical protein LBI42_12780 [Chitinispirillales bacterium]|jgi:hypothetical protein|nr:hypothetical protein [Chitinispirillales bacterium]
MAKGTMSISEKLDISMRAIALKKAGDREGYDRLMKTLPLPPYIAKVTKEKEGLDVLLNSGWNLSEVEAEFGAEWLKK